MSGGCGARVVESVRRARLAFGLLGVVQVVLILAITVIAVALPAIARDLDLDQAELILINAAYGASFSGLLLLGGRLADQVGRRRILLVGVSLFGLASVVAGVAPRFEVLLAARFAQGCGAALTAPAAMALVGVLFPDPSRRAQAMAIWGGLAGIGAVTGTVLSGVFVMWLSWRWAFAVPAATAAVAVLAGPALLPAGPVLPRTRLDLPGAVLVTLGLSAVSWALAMLGDHPVHSEPVLMPLGLGTAAIAGFVFVESRSRAPLMPLSLLAPVRRRAALLAIFLAAAGSSTVLFFFALYFQQVRGYSPLATSGAFLPFGLALLATGPVSGWLVARVSVRAITAAGLLLGSAGLLLLACIGADTPYTGALLTGLLVFPFGLGLTFSGATVAAVDGASDTDAGMAGALVNVALETGPPIGLALLASLASLRATRLGAAGLTRTEAATSGYSFALAAASFVFLICAGLALTAMTPRGRRHEHT